MEKTVDSSTANLPLISKSLKHASIPKDKTWEPSVSTVFLKFLYAGTLLTPRPEQFLDFWDRHPLSVGKRVYSGPQLLEFIWNTTSAVPFSYATKIFDSLETELVSRNSSITALLKPVLSRITAGGLIPSSLLLYASKHLIEGFIRSTDRHSFILRSLQDVSRYFAPDTPHYLFSTKNRNDHTEAIMMFLPDRQLHHRYPGLDPFLWIAEMTRTIPSCFGLKPFDSVGMLSDYRSVGEILLNNGKTLTKGDRLFIDGQNYGRVIPFRKFCSEHSLKLSQPGPDNLNVIQIDRDYHCPKRKRIVLHAGCVYGAPVCFYSIKYTRHDDSPVNSLGILIENISREKEVWRTVERKHRQLLESEKKLNFVYDAEEQTLSLGHKHLLRGVPARILFTMLLEFAEDRRTLFTYGEFQKDPSIVPEPTTPNLAIRFNRIASTLKRKVPQLNLVKDGRGRLRLRTSSSVSIIQR